MTIDGVMEEIRAYTVNRVTVTGGEPLAQAACVPFLKTLCDSGFAVSLETSGALPVGAVDGRVSKVMDLKTPSSGESERNCYDNVAHLGRGDEIKFVVSDRGDYEWAKEALTEHALLDHPNVLFSPNHETLHPRELGEWILADRLPVRLQVQLHKYLWGDERGR